MGQRPYFNQGLLVHCLAFSVKMGINFCILLIVGFHCVSGNPLEEKRWGQSLATTRAIRGTDTIIPAAPPARKLLAAGHLLLSQPGRVSRFWIMLVICWFIMFFASAVLQLPVSLELQALRASSTLQPFLSMTSGLPSGATSEIEEAAVAKHVE